MNSSAQPLTPWHQRGPLVAEKAVTEQFCDKLLAEIDGDKGRPRSYQGVVDVSQRSCDYVALPGRLSAIVGDVIGDHVDDYFATRSKPVEQQAPLIYRYGEGVGFVTHHDEVTDVELERAEHNGQPVVGGDLTTLLFLNCPSNYVGGALYFENPALELRPPKGSLVAFPATRDFMHGVRPIEDGERFTLLARRNVVRTNP